MNINFN